MKVELITFLLLTSSFIYGADAPLIAVEGKSKIDFGTYPGKDRKEATFVIVNNGKADLKIGKIRKTCGCAVAKIDKLVLKPGKKSKLLAVVLGDSIYGAYSKNIYVESNTPGKRFLTLTIAGKAIPLLKVKPKINIYAGTIPEGKTWSQDFLIEATQKDVKIGECTSTGPHKVDIKLTKESDTKWRLKVTVTPAEKSTIFKSKIKVPVVEPKGWKGVELTVMGKIAVKK